MERYNFNNLEGGQSKDAYKPNLSGIPTSCKTSMESIECSMSNISLVSANHNELNGQMVPSCECGEDGKQCEHMGTRRRFSDSDIDGNMDLKMNRRWGSELGGDFGANRY